MHLLSVHTTPPHDLLEICFEEQKYLVLASKEIKGNTLFYELLNKNNLNLDLIHFSQLTIMSMIINPEADNYIVEENTRRIVGIDNDHAFVPALKERSLIQKENIIHVKCILFCMDEMNDPVHPMVREQILNMDPVDILKKWLIRLQKQNTKYESQFSVSEMEHYFKQDPSVVIPIYLRPGLVSCMYQKLVYIQETLKENPRITHIDLLTLLEPDLGKLYGQELKKKTITTLHRFNEITKGEYVWSKNNMLITQTKSKDILVSITKVNPKYIHDMQTTAHSPGQGLKELRNIVLQRSGIDQIADDLTNGTGVIFNMVSVPELAEKVLKFISFKDLEDEKQKKVLERIRGKGIRKFYLSHCAVLTDKMLKHLLP